MIYLCPRALRLWRKLLGADTSKLLTLAACSGTTLRRFSEVRRKMAHSITLSAYHNCSLVIRKVAKSALFCHATNFVPPRARVNARARLRVRASLDFVCLSNLAHIYLEIIVLNDTRDCEAIGAKANRAAFNISLTFL